MDFGAKHKSLIGDVARFTIKTEENILQVRTKLCKTQSDFKGLLDLALGFVRAARTKTTL
jgi:hypothetical protein